MSEKQTKTKTKEKTKEDKIEVISFILKELETNHKLLTQRVDNIESGPPL